MLKSQRSLSIMAWVTGTLMIVGSLGYLLLKGVFLSQHTVDFKYIWLAGHMWSMGENPYAPLFRTLGEQIFVGENRPTFFVYPPSWWIISKLSSYFEPDIGGRVWRCMSVLWLLSGSWLLVDALKRSGLQVTRSRAVVFLSFACLMSATPMCIAMGQTSLLIFFGVTLFIRAYLLNSQGQMTAALFILMLKPNVGLLFGMFLLVQPFWYRALLISGASVVASMVPPFLISGVLPTLGGFVTRLGEYGKEAVNLPPTMTGIRHMAYEVAHVDLSPFLLAACGSAFIMLFFFVIAKGGRVRAKIDGADKAMLLMILLISVCTFIPLHSYDFTLVAALILLAAPFTAGEQALLLPPLVLIFRANNLADVLNARVFQTEYVNENMLTTVAVFLMVAGGVVLCARHMAQRKQEEGSWKND